jgi:acetyl-CoA synthetase
MTTPAQNEAIEALLHEVRRFPPPPAFAAAANAKPGIYETAERDSEAWWASWARKLEWMKPFTRGLEWKEPFATWFADGELNASVNALDRHVKNGLAARVAYYYEGEPGDRWSVTYGELLDMVCRFANGLRKLGIKKGDRVAIYMPMIVELPVAMLACARIGAAHSVIFGGFSPDAIVDRVNDSKCVAIITADQGWRRGKHVPLKDNVDEAIAKGMPSLKHVVVAKRVGEPVAMAAGRDHWWDEVIAGQPSTCEPERMNAEDLLFLLYTSGTTAKPKGIKHTTGGYLTGVTATHQLVFDLKAEHDIYWCAADIGWVTGHSYIVYGPLCNGATSVIYEGTPDFPDKDRLWEIIERYKVTILYTAPTAIRTFMKWGTEFVEKHDMTSLRLLGSVGEPINPEAWIWYHTHIGGGRCPVVDTWWQTETGAIMITPLPGIIEAKPGSATRPFPGVLADVVDERDGKPLEEGQGLLVLQRPWPSMLRTLYKEDDRFVETYFSRFGKETYLVGDAARKDKDGYFWIIGRIDDVVNVSGHRLSTAEVESAIVSYRKVAEAAVIGQTDEDTGQSICAFVTLEGDDAEGSDALIDEIRGHVADRIGKFARPKRIVWADDLPKTRSGKIMRRLLRDIAEGRTLGDVTTLRDPAVMEQLEGKIKEEQAAEE